MILLGSLGRHTARLLVITLWMTLLQGATLWNWVCPGLSQINGDREVPSRQIHLDRTTRYGVSVRRILLREDLSPAGDDLSAFLHLTALKEDGFNPRSY